MEPAPNNPGGFSPLAIPRELWRLTSGWLTHASVGLPWRLARAAVGDSSMVPWGDGKLEHSTLEMELITVQIQK